VHGVFVSGASPQSCHARSTRTESTLLRGCCCDGCVSFRPSVHPSYISNKHQGIFVSLKGKSPSTNLPIPSNDHICSATTKQTRSLITTTPPQSSPSLSSDAATPQLSKYFPPYCTLHPRNPTFPQPVHLPLRPFDSQLHSALTHQSRPRHSPARSE
jgi:hypothetical protein